MSIVVIGLNHRTVPLDLLERMTINDAQLPKALHDLTAREHISESVVLSTCNRTEVYAVAEKFHGAVADIRNFLSEMAYLPPEGFSDHLYTHYDVDAARHLFGVSAGLDSAVLGETEILGQVKSAWEKAREEGAAGSSLNMLFRHAVEVGKRARAETGISRHIASVSSAAVAMAAERLGSLSGRRVLVLGAGDMGEGMVRSLVDAGVADVRVANRTWQKAVDLAAQVEGRAVRLVDLPVVLAETDLLLTSTGANSILVQASDLAPAMEGRIEPLLVVDVAVPRDVDPAVAEIDGVTLLDMDDLRVFAEAGLEGRRREVASVRHLLDEELERFVLVSSAREVAPLVADLREHAETIRSSELARFAARLEQLDARERETIEALTKGIVAKLLHDPTVQLKNAAGSPRGERLAEALRDLFAL